MLPTTTTYNSTTSRPEDSSVYNEYNLFSVPTQEPESNINPNIRRYDQNGFPSIPMSVSQFREHVLNISDLQKTDNYFAAQQYKNWLIETSPNLNDFLSSMHLSRSFPQGLKRPPSESMFDVDEKALRSHRLRQAEASVTRSNEVGRRQTRPDSKTEVTPVVPSENEKRDESRPRQRRGETELRAEPTGNTNKRDYFQPNIYFRT